MNRTIDFLKFANIFFLETICFNYMIKIKINDYIIKKKIGKTIIKHVNWGNKSCLTKLVNQVIDSTKFNNLVF
jgi:predicted Abi (CAAX) family protease